MSDELSVILIDTNRPRLVSVAALLRKTGIDVQIHTRHKSRDWSDLEQTVVMIAEDEMALDEMLDFVGCEERPPVIVYSERVNVRRIVDAISRGAIDYLLLPTTLTQLKTTLTQARQKASVSARGSHRGVVAAARIDRLTKRERQVLLGVANGLSNRLIGQELEISPRTVEIHRANMMAKLGVRHVSEVVRIAIAAGQV